MHDNVTRVFKRGNAWYLPAKISSQYFEHCPLFAMIKCILWLILLVVLSINFFSKHCVVSCLYPLAELIEPFDCYVTPVGIKLLNSFHDMENVLYTLYIATSRWYSQGLSSNFLGRSKRHEQGPSFDSDRQYPFLASASMCENSLSTGSLKNKPFMASYISQRTTPYL